MAEENETDILKLIKELLPGVTLLDAERVRQIMQEHAKLAGSGRRAAKEAGVSSTYWQRAATGNQPIGDKIAKGYHLRHVDIWELVED